jgi:hypothetical protein
MLTREAPPEQAAMDTPVIKQIGPPTKVKRPSTFRAEAEYKPEVCNKNDTQTRHGDEKEKREVAMHAESFNERLYHCSRKYEHERQERGQKKI